MNLFLQSYTVIKRSLVILLIVIHVSDSLKFVTHPEANLNMEQKIRKRGYPLDIHEVVTEDNYILTIHRIPHGKHAVNGTTKKRSPILLLHGMCAQPEYFLVLGKHSIVYYLADRGFDVWILNARGTMYSKKHKYFDSETDSRYYWMFSYHEIAVYDIPTNIDYIVSETNEKVFLIGHSQGNTCYFVLASEKPEYNEKIKISIVYAPSVLLKYADYPLAEVFAYLVDVFEIIYNILGMGVLFPVNDTVALLAKVLCSETTYFLEICSKLLDVIGSHKSKLITKEIVTLIFSIQPTTISARQLFHYMQGLKSGLFRQYDFGEDGNLKKYGFKTPPEYNITRASGAVAIFRAENDEFSSLQGVEATIKLIPNMILNYKVPYKYFNHVDFIFGKNASNLVYKKTVQIMKTFDNGKLVPRKREITVKN